MKTKFFFLIVALCLSAAANWVLATPQLNPASRSVAAAGETITFTVRGSIAGESGTLTSNAGWITLAPPSWSGTAPVTITVKVAANTDAEPRDGTVTVTGAVGSSATFTVTQAGVPSTLSLDYTTKSQGYRSFGSGAMVTSNTSWTAVSNAAWVTITSGSSGSGDGWVTYDVSENTTTATREGKITFTTTDGTKSETLTITQYPPPTVLTVTPATLNIPASGGWNFYADVTVDNDAHWEIVNKDDYDWITIYNGGSEIFLYLVEENTSPTERTATYTVESGTLTATFTVIQAGTVSFVQTVNVGSQSGPLYAETEGTVSFPLTTTNIANGFYGVAVANLPTGVQVSGNVSINNNTGILTLTGYSSTVAGVYSTLTLHIANVISAPFTLTIEGASGMEELAWRDIAVYPNPTKGELKIEHGDGQMKLVEVFDATGKKHLSTSPLTASIDISRLPAGVYFVRIITETGVLVVRVVKE